MKKVYAFILFLIMLCAFLLSASACNIFRSAISDHQTPTVSTDVNDHSENTRERFVASLATQNDLSYEEADRLEAQTASQILRDPDERIKYETLDKVAGTISGTGISQKVYISTEVRYLYSNATSKATYIENIGSPTIYLDGIDSQQTSFSNSDFNIEQYSTSGRISYTTAVSYEIDGVDVSSGGDIVGVSFHAGSCTVTSRAKTFAISITLSDLP